VAPRAVRTDDGGAMDVFAFALVLLTGIWIAHPLIGRPWVLTATTIAGLTIAVTSATWRYDAKRLGLRLDTFLPSLLLYVPAGLLYASASILLAGGFVPQPSHHPWYEAVPWRLLWGFMQEFCLLAFILNRITDLLRRPVPAALLASAIFALFHLPNPFLSLYTLGGGILLTLFFQRVPNLITASIVHAMASLMVSRFLPETMTGRLRVGALYWMPPWGR
jgi:membrane protease YdiL (CAAX protease family)